MAAAVGPATPFSRGGDGKAAIEEFLVHPGLEHAHGIGAERSKSYEKGDEDYEEDISNRFKHGELYSADSIKFSDSTKYQTNAKRTVFGGGGIMPDVFVPLDTAFNSKYYTDLVRKSVLSDFALTYTDNNRARLKATYADAKSFKDKFIIDAKMSDDFYAFAEKKGVTKDEEGVKRSGKFIFEQLRALMARDLWNTSAYFQVINDEDETFMKAVQCIKDNTFDKMKIAHKTIKEQHKKTASFLAKKFENIIDEINKNYYGYDNGKNHSRQHPLIKK